ncbi:TRAP transporter small permease [Limibacillus sp. MBR-115]|jgi:TRAP-type C4-dicarboxylate transport system permease small subunit|uniref:TRAP transporter small permease n=1 Tax=Limibacillus sp. MBR-115 TaxID=3156465 RepID=UPI003392D696
MNLINKCLQRLEEGVATTLIAVLMLTIGAQIFFRYFLNSPLSWSEEFSQFMLICLSFVAATAVLKRGEHYSIDTFVNMLPSSLRRIVEVGSLVVALVLLVALAFYSFRIGVLYAGTHSLILKIPEEVKAYLMGYCFLSMALHIVVRIVQSLEREA